MNIPGFAAAQAQFDNATPPYLDEFRCVCGHSSDDHYQTVDGDVCDQCDCDDLSEGDE